MLHCAPIDDVLLHFRQRSGSSGHEPGVKGMTIMNVRESDILSLLGCSACWPIDIARVERIYRFYLSYLESTQRMC